MKSHIYPLTHRQSFAFYMAAVSVVGFILMILALLVNFMAGGGSNLKYGLMVFLFICLYMAVVTLFAARAHCREADGKRYLVMLDDLGVRWAYYDAQAAAAHFKPSDEFYVQQDFSWEQVRDVQVLRHNWPRRFGRVVLNLAPQEAEAPDEIAELNLMYFENNETADSFAEEVLYRFVKSR
ncbi:MAG: hypothetical protein Q4C79_00595 [Neisseria sp.]|uniref:hypothetical protein n=1 Tax=Neisseria sp. TaxID=192066 RepID=UPI0026DAF46A|nr:hypothetical protein [Neisseria sp.]MDO4247456.1 hypothetical protein [Neisseria sp.]